MENYKTGYLQRLPSGFSKGNYYGFTLKKDSLFGRDSNGIPIACTGNHRDGKYFIYKLIGEKWLQEEISFDELLMLLCSK